MIAHLPTLKEFSDDEILAELGRRKRLRELSVSRMYYTEMKDHNGYLEGIDKSLGNLMGAKILESRVAIIQERIGVMPMNNSPMTNRDVSVLVITPVITILDGKAEEVKDETAVQQV